MRRLREEWCRGSNYWTDSITTPARSPAFHYIWTHTHRDNDHDRPWWWLLLHQILLQIQRGVLSTTSNDHTWHRSTHHTLLILFCITFTFSSYTFNSIWYVSLSLSPALLIIGFLTFTFSPFFIFYLLATVVNLWPLYFNSTEQQMSFIQSLAKSRKMMIKIFALLCEN